MNLKILIPSRCCVFAAQHPLYAIFAIVKSTGMAVKVVAYPQDTLAAA